MYKSAKTERLFTLQTELISLDLYFWQPAALQQIG